MLPGIFRDLRAYIQSSYLCFPSGGNDAGHSVKGEVTTCEGSADCNTCNLSCSLVSVIVFPLDQ